MLGELLVSGAIKEPRLAEADLVSFTEVRVSPDLSLARVFTSIFPSEEAVVSTVMEALEEAKPHIRSLVAREVRLRHTPELRFHWDESIERGARVEALLKAAREEDEAMARAREGTEGSPSSSDAEPSAASGRAPEEK